MRIRGENETSHQVSLWVGRAVEMLRLKGSSLVLNFKHFSHIVSLEHTGGVNTV